MSNPYLIDLEFHNFVENGTWPNHQCQLNKDLGNINENLEWKSLGTMSNIGDTLSYPMDYHEISFFVYNANGWNTVSVDSFYKHVIDRILAIGGKTVGLPNSGNPVTITFSSESIKLNSYKGSNGSSAGTNSRVEIYYR